MNPPENTLPEIITKLDHQTYKTTTDVTIEQEALQERR